MWDVGAAGGKNHGVLDHADSGDILDLSSMDETDLLGEVRGIVVFPLLNLLFEVLFIFPSRYLLAIGLSPVFSLRWNLPPALGCIPKQPDSVTAPRGANRLYS